MLLSINQPAYLPWLGYYDRIARSDIHVVLDHVQFEKNSMINRNKVRTQQGWCWLTVPVKTKGHFGNLGINKLEIGDVTGWSTKHLKTIHACYAKAKYYQRYINYFDELLNRDWPVLNPLLKDINSYILDQLGIRTKIVYSSDFDYSASKSKLLLQICQQFSADSYLSGPYGRDYLDKKLFNEAGIDVIYQDYSHPVYSQVYPGFESHMSIIDLLFNHGDDSFSILMNEDINNGLASHVK